MTTTSLYCPYCGQLDSVRKVSAIVSSGTSSGRYTGYGDGIGYSSGGMMVMDELITLTGSSQTQLSSLLSPPIRPRDRSFGRKFESLSSIFLILVGLFGFLTVIVSLANFNSETGTTGALFLGLVCIGIPASVFTFYWIESPKEKLLAESEMSEWQKAKYKWQHLYYCYRCDVVYVPGENTIVPSQYMMDFLYNDK